MRQLDIWRSFEYYNSLFGTRIFGIFDYAVLLLLFVLLLSYAIRSNYFKCNFDFFYLVFEYRN